jgi:hypothetical protein
MNIYIYIFIYIFIYIYIYIYIMYTHTLATPLDPVFHAFTTVCLRALVLFAMDLSLFGWNLVYSPPSPPNIV